jgi:2-oxoglutarate dehydrogenase E2 component (dihydrolipoamide succinyltransferase)
MENDMLDIVVPSPGESITEVTLGQWHKQDGDWVETDEVLVDIESDKATLEVRAPAAGVLRVKVQSGSEQKVGSPIGAIDTSVAKPAGGAAKAGAAAAAAPAAAVAAVATTVIAEPVDGKKASSLAKKVAADKGVDLAKVTGSGTSGRIVNDCHSGEEGSASCGANGGCWRAWRSAREDAKDQAAHC